MAFDQTTRNRLTRFVSDARILLTEEFTRQLQNEYGLDPSSGDVTPIDRLTALDDRRRETAKILRETLEYYLAGNSKVDEKANRDILDRIVREQAFTVLNRLCALRMSEARGLVLESIAKGYQSKGFQLYMRLAGSALGETGETYRMYLFSLMDEFAADLPVLFDRFSPQGRLFPREAALLKLIELINDPEIEPLWAEDETIGWIYQYFNSKEERKAMRDASSAPRNSRELAVRNQFFTPRYVVEFLTDNTLGRIWYEMTKGETALKDTCRYLVRRPTEIFLNEGEEAQEQTETDEDLSQEDLLLQPVYIPHCPLKDPREIKMLDPACGSMHFGLYAFDLFEQIYAEAWELEERLGEDALQRLADLDSLHKTYPDKETYLKDVPRLIIERNIHGVDIDPRAVQIAGLSLWLRAQRSWQAQGLQPGERPQIRKSNVVCAEPMPGDRQMLEEFLGTLRGEGLEALIRKAWHVPTEQKVKATPQMADALTKLVRTVWQEMELAGEAGSLLKIEETLRDAIAAARKESEEKSPLFRVLEYGLGEASKEQYVLLVAGEDQDFFDRAEGLVLAALKDYAEHAVNGESYQRRLFSGDAIQGFDFIDICRKQFDVILMNPPFGDYPKILEGMIKGVYRLGWIDLYTCFIIRSKSLICSNGKIGCITSRTFLYLRKLSEFRKKVLLNSLHPLFIVDLGAGILDSAAVETCLSVFDLINLIPQTIFVDLRDARDKNLGFLSSINQLNDSSISDSISASNIYFSSHNLFNSLTDCVFAYYVPSQIAKLYLRNRRFETLAQGVPGLTSRDNDRFLRLSWEIPIGNSRWIPFSKGGSGPRFYQEMWLSVDWSKNGASIKQKAMEYGGPASRFIVNENKYFLEGLTYPRVGKEFSVRVLPKGCIFAEKGIAIQLDEPDKDENNLLSLLGFLNSDVVEYLISLNSPGRFWETGSLNRIPIPNDIYHSGLDEIAIKGFKSALCEFMKNENSRLFVNPIIDIPSFPIDEVRKECSRIVRAIYGIKDNVNLLIKTNDIEDSDEDSDDYVDTANASATIISYTIGCLFGRWNIEFLNNKNLPTSYNFPFAQLPVCPPGLLQDDQGLLVQIDDIKKNYPIRVSWKGIVVDDPGHKDDIENRILDVLSVFGRVMTNKTDQEICSSLGVDTLRAYFQKPTLFFADHLKRYSKSRRAAPIYWPLSTPSCSYTLWLYYHRLSDQTFYTCVNDFVDPKLKQVSDEAARLRLKKGRSTNDEKELERLTDFERELRDFREELLRVAKFWKPNLNDGVEITAAPLWKLFQHKPWQKRLKETWQKLEAGEYDWSHLAYSIWPERVREKCKSDKSLAIAHDLEELYVEPPASAKKKKAKKPAVDEETEGWFNDD